MRRLLFALASVAAGAWLVFDRGVDREPAARDAPPPAARIEKLLPARASLPEGGADPFLAGGRGLSRLARAAPTAPAVPPLPYRFVGRVYQEGGTQVYIARGAKLIAVRQGDVLDGEYSVAALSASEIAFVHLASGSRQVIALGPPIESAARPARWSDSLTMDRSHPAGGDLR